MSVAAIEVRFPDKILKPDDVEEPRVLTTLEVIYEGGSLDGKTYLSPETFKAMTTEAPAMRAVLSFQPLRRTPGLRVRRLDVNQRSR